MVKRTKLFVVHLSFMHDSCVFPNIDRVLQPIGEAIATSLQDVETSNFKNVADEYLDAFVEDDIEVVENLLGTAFVICQTYISTVISRVRALHRLYEKEHNSVALTTTSTNRPDIMAFGSPRVGNSRLSEVQVIDAFANYFKHQAEWNRDWDKLPQKSALTAQVISAVGASRGATGNLRTGAKVLGNESYAKVSLFADILRRWLQNIHDGYQKELELKHLI